MKKIFIEDARIDSFMIDLRERVACSLKKSSADIDRLVIVGIGESGTQVVSRFMATGVPLPQAKDETAFVVVQKHDDAYTAILSVSQAQIPFDDFIKSEGARTGYLLLDGVCRSGSTLTAIYAKLRAASKRVWTYAVAVSADSALIPTWYGCLYESNEYVVLTRDGATPNTALHASTLTALDDRMDTPALVLRPPLPGDPDFKTSAPSLSRYTADDRYFDSTTRAKSILVLEWDSEPVGFVAFHIDSATLWIDYIISCETARDAGKKGIGTALYYHVENFAKLRGCQQINLWAISDMEGWYIKRGFSRTAGKHIEFGTDKPEKYYPMTHSLISDSGHYHI